MVLGTGPAEMVCGGRRQNGDGADGRDGGAKGFGDETVRAVGRREKGCCGRSFVWHDAGAKVHIFGEW